MTAMALALAVCCLLVGDGGARPAAIRNPKFSAPDGENANLSRIRKRWHLWTDSFGKSRSHLRSRKQESKKDEKVPASYFSIIGTLAQAQAKSPVFDSLSALSTSTVHISPP